MVTASFLHEIAWQLTMLECLKRHGIKCRLAMGDLMGLFGKSKPKDTTIEQMRILLDNFQFADLQNFCTEVLGTKPAIDREHMSSIEVLDFVWDQYHKGSISFPQLKDFAIKHNIVTESFFE